MSKLTDLYISQEAIQDIRNWMLTGNSFFDKKAIDKCILPDYSKMIRETTDSDLALALVDEETNELKKCEIVFEQMVGRCT